MEPETKLKVLKFLMGYGMVLVFIGGILWQYLMPDAFLWQPFQPEYVGMMAMISLPLVFLTIWASRDPIRHISLVYFNIISGFAHGGIMVVFALIEEAERMHFLGDIPAIFAFNILLLVFIPWKLLKQYEQKKT